MKIYYNNEKLTNLTSDKIVKLSTSELEEIANLQKECLYKNHPLDKSKQQEEIQKILI